MHGGRSRTHRSMLVAQAALVWSDKMTAKDYANFIETGVIGSSATDVAPYSPAVMEAMAETWKWSG